MPDRNGLAVNLATQEVAVIMDDLLEAWQEYRGGADCSTGEFWRAIDAHDAEVRADERDKVAQAIMNERTLFDNSGCAPGIDSIKADAYDAGLDTAARIARESGGA